VRVSSTEEAASLVRREGGRLYVWAERGNCCGGTMQLSTSTAPDARRRFERVAADEFEVWFPVGARLPDELALEARRGRVRAYWDGCAWVT
jgi:hypothetical protein